MNEFLSQLLTSKGIFAPLTVPANVEVTKRSGTSDEHLIIINHNEHDIELELDEGNSYTNLVTHDVVSENFRLKGNDAAVLHLANN